VKSSAKKLRGDAMIDVICNGLYRTQAVHNGSVELVFD